MPERPYNAGADAHLTRLEIALFGNEHGRFLEEFLQQAERLQQYIKLLEGGLGSHEARERVWGHDA